MPIRRLLLFVIALAVCQPATGQTVDVDRLRDEIAGINRQLEELKRLELERKRREQRERTITQLAAKLMVADGKKKGLSEYRELLVHNANRYRVNEEAIVHHTAQTAYRLNSLDQRYTNKIVLGLLARTGRRGSYSAVCASLIYKVREAYGDL